MVDYTKWDRIDYEDYDTSSSVDDDDDNATLLQSKPRREIGEHDEEDEEDDLVNNSLNEMLEHVSTMNVNDAYYQLCLVQDEISRLKKGLEVDNEVVKEQPAVATQPQQEEEGSILKQQSPPGSNTTTITIWPTGGQLGEKDRDDDDDDDDDDNIRKSMNGSSSKQQNQSLSNKAPAKAAHSLRRRMKASGSWLNDDDHHDSGTTRRLVSIEYLPNIQSYQITLILLPASSLISSSSSTPLLPTKEDLHFTINPMRIVENEGLDNSVGGSSLLPQQWAISTLYFEAKLYQSMKKEGGSSSSLSSLSSSFIGNDIHKEQQQYQQQRNNLQLLLSLTLPTPCYSSCNRKELTYSTTILCETNSISIRIQFQQNNSNSSTMVIGGDDIMIDNLLGLDENNTAGTAATAVTTATTCPETLNYLRCRACQNYITNSQQQQQQQDDGNDKNNTSSGKQTTSVSGSIIQSILPLPIGYWEDISEYLSCYDGQAVIDFTNIMSNIVVIPNIAYEDSTILVLHRDNVSIIGGSGSNSNSSNARASRSGVCILNDDRLVGYGEHHSSTSNNNNEDANDGMPSTILLSWKDKGMSSTTETCSIIACANCYLTLGYVSNNNSSDRNTLRLYKHLLDCGSKPNNYDDDNSDENNIKLCGNGRTRNDSNQSSLSLSTTTFSKYTCISFLANEMVRYAESNAIYTFIVGVSDVYDWTRMGISGSSSSEDYILLRILSWDTPMSTITSSGEEGGREMRQDDMLVSSSLSIESILCFQKAVKVIYEVVNNNDTTRHGRPFSKSTNSTVVDSDDSLVWTWRGNNDFCCPSPSPRFRQSPLSTSSTTTTEVDSCSQTNATAVKIYFTKREWSELKDALVMRSQYFSDTVTNAIVMTKLGGLSMMMDDDNDDDNASSLRQQQHTRMASLSFLPLVN